jgi:hypothetical protein
MMGWLSNVDRSPPSARCRLPAADCRLELLTETAD